MTPQLEVFDPFSAGEGLDATGSRSGGTIDQFEVHVGGRHHGLVTLGDRRILGASVDFPVALLELLAETSNRPKPLLKLGIRMS